MRNWTKLLPIALTISLLSCSEEKVVVTGPALLPTHAPVILSINDAGAFATAVDTLDWPFLEGVPAAQLARWNSGRWTGALVPSGAGKMDWIWTTDQLRDSLSGTPITYNGTTLYALDSGFAYTANGVWAVSYTQGLVQDAINQFDRGHSLLDNAEFSKLWDNASRGDLANAFIQHKELGPVGTLYFGQDWSWLQHFASWTELDLAVRSNSLMLTSVSLCSDSSLTYLSTFDGRASSQSLSEVVPNSAAYALGMRTGDPVDFLRGYNAYRGKKQRLKTAINLLNQAGMDELTAATAFEGSFVRVGYGEGVVVGAKLTKNHGLESLLPSISSSNSPYQGMPSGQLKEDHRFVFSALFGWFFTDLDTPNWVIYKDWLLLAPQRELMEVYLSELRLGKVWKETEAYAQLATKLDENDHFTLALPMASNAGTHPLPEELPAYFSRALLTGSVDVKDDLAFGSLSVNSPKKAQAPSGAAYLWSAPLQATATAGPWLVKNHRSGMQNVVVQDDAGTLYWLDENGSVSWTLALGGPIVGEVHQVDLYQNNKYQLLFTTAEKLYCVDLLGRSVEGYPVTLKGKTTTGVSVVDYDKNRSYRFLVAVGDQLYNYTGDGKLVNGWKTDAAGGNITQAAQLYQKGGKDYVIVSTAERAVVLNRRGEERIKTSKLAASTRPWVVLDGNVPAVARTTEEGGLQVQRWDGTTDVLSDPLGDLLGLSRESYGVVYWTDEELELRSESKNRTLELDGISRVHTYPGGTGVVFKEDGTLTVVLLTDMERISDFEGTGAKAGRLSPTGAPVLIVLQNDAVIAYQL